MNSIIIDKEEFERRKVTQITQKYEYGSITYSELLQSLVQMGWDKYTMDKILKNHYQLE